MSRKKLFNFILQRNSDFIEIGGGEGDLCLELLNAGCKFILYVEPDVKKFRVARRKILPINFQNKDISRIDFNLINPCSDSVTVIMQDVIEHISKNKLRVFFLNLSKIYSRIYFIGRTPNLKSPFGLRNSFGDNTHIHRFTDTSLNSFLKDLGFNYIFIKNENYKITGITSFFRYFPYLLVIFIISIIFLIIFGSWEGLLAPNLVFQAQKVIEKND